MVKDDIKLQTISEAGWLFSAAMWGSLDNYQKQFALLEFSGQRTFDYYKKRLQMIGFSKKKKVLDAACGMGQWSVALASLNLSVEGIDLSEERIEVARNLAVAHEVNCSFRTGTLEDLPYENEFFDAVFCYGAFMFTDMERTLQEFIRVLKPGGTIYLNANTWGWYAHLLLDRGFKQMNLSLIYTTIKILVRTLLRRKSQIVVSERKLRAMFNSSGVRIIEVGTEGSICFYNNRAQWPQPAYQNQFYGLRSMLEVLGEVSNK